MSHSARTIKQTTLLVGIIILILGFSACLEKAIQEEAKSLKYMFLFIGDGMGLSQIHSAEIMEGALNSDEIEIQKLSFSKFPGTGIMTTFSSNSYITDSAAAGTAMASGKKTVNGRINIDETNKVKFKTITEMAKEKGMKVGIISNVSLNHATPASFYANVTSRSHYYEIAKQMVESGFDFFGGGGIKYPKGRRGLQTDVLELAKQKGYKVIQLQNDFLSLGKENRGEKIIALNEKITLEIAMPYRIDINENDLTLIDYVDKCIDILDSDNGFFMMVEGGKIDWAAHDNDAGTLIKEVKDFDQAVQRAVQFYKQHPEDTLIVVTADHECGGMGLGSICSGYSQSMEILSSQTVSLINFTDEHIKPYKATKNEPEWNLDDFMPLIEEKFGLIKLSKEEEEKLKEKAHQGNKEAIKRMGRVLSTREYNELQRSLQDPNSALFGSTLVKILNQKAGISWTSDAHTAVPIPVFSIGKCYEKFVGYYDNTDLFNKLSEVMSLNTNIP
jgi:alkaline phosphatase